MGQMIAGFAGGNIFTSYGTANVSFELSARSHAAHPASSSSTPMKSFAFRVAKLAFTLSTQTSTGNSSAGGWRSHTW